MDIDFSFVLVCLVAGCGVIWLLDSLLVKGGRVKAAEAFCSARQQRPKTERRTS